MVSLDAGEEMWGVFWVFINEILSGWCVCRLWIKDEMFR